MVSLELMEYVGDNIDKLVTLEMRTYPSGRGKTPLLYEAARRKVRRSLTLTAAELLVKAVKPNDMVIITAGWVIPPLLPRGESDGVSGSIALARSINYGLEGRTVFLTEEPVIPVLEAGSIAAGLRRFEIDYLKKTPRAGAGAGGVAIETFPMGVDEARIESKRLLDDLKPSAIVAIEKCGRNEKGVYHSGLGNDMSDSTIKVDYLIDEANARGIPTISVIDLGNEIGSGNIVDDVKQIAKYGSKCLCPCGAGLASIVETTAVIVASACSFGGFGLVACLSRLLENLAILHNASRERRIMEACYKAGMLDGATLTPDLVLNGVPLEDYAPLIELMNSVIAQSYKHVRFEEEKLRR